jgi:predicted lipoprotein with Yx(FWY)xxD motif
LYVLTPSAVACDSACLKIWPAVTVRAHAKGATAGSGVKKSKLGTTSGPGGIRQVTYNGKALYFFAGDTTKGQVKGNITDQWGKWTAVVVKPAHSSGSSSGSGSNSGSGTSGTNAGGGGVSF